MLQDDFIAIWNRIFKRSVWKVEEGLQYLDLYESAEKEERHDYTVPDSGRGCGWKSSGEREKLRFTDGGYGVLGDKEERYKRGAWGETVIKNVGSVIFR